MGYNSVAIIKMPSEISMYLAFKRPTVLVQILVHFVFQLTASTLLYHARKSCASNVSNLNCAPARAPKFRVVD